MLWIFVQKFKTIGTGSLVFLRKLPYILYICKDVVKCSGKVLQKPLYAIKRTCSRTKYYNSLEFYSDSGHVSAPNK